MARRFQLRRDTAANWTSVNPVLAVGEPGFETDTGFMKVGDGASAWNALDYWRGGDALSAFSALTPAADRLPYYTGASTAALAVVTAFARSLLAAGNAASARTLLEAASSGDVATISSTLTAVANDLDALEAAALVDSDVGTTAGKLVALDGDAKLPAVDGSNLTNLPSAPGGLVQAQAGTLATLASFSAAGVWDTLHSFSAITPASVSNLLMVDCRFPFAMNFGADPVNNFLQVGVFVDSETTPRKSFDVDLTLVSARFNVAGDYVGHVSALLSFNPSNLSAQTVRLKVRKTNDHSWTRIGGGSEVLLMEIEQ